MQRVSLVAMAEEGSRCPVPRLPWAFILRGALLLMAVVLAGSICYFCSQGQTQRQCEPPGWDVAELHLNLTVCHLREQLRQGPSSDKAGKTPDQLEADDCPRKDQRLYWYGSPALGRSFLLGPELDKGQLRIQRDGIYRLHVQVTLTNCSSTSLATPHKATLVVGICSSATHSISLLRLNFEQRCAVASQRLTPLSLGDILCTNLTLPLLPSRNTDETFFGVQWVHP